MRGQALAEMAIMVPFLVIAMMGFLDLGRAFYYQIALTNAVREAARYAAIPLYQGPYPAGNISPPSPTPGPSCPTPTDAQICQRVIAELQGTGFSASCPGDVAITPDQHTRTTNYAANTTQYPITVAGTYRFTFITPIMGSLIGNPLTLNTSAVFRAEY